MLETIIKKKVKFLVKKYLKNFKNKKKKLKK